MSDNYCPACGENLPVESINLSEGVALCNSCGRLSRLADVASRKRPLDEILRQPPPGCRVTEHGQDIVVHTSLRSVTSFVGALAVCLFWNGIVSLFVLVAATGLYTNLIGPLPNWFPTPEIDDSMSLGTTLFMCLFLTPFVVAGSVMLGAVLLYGGGKLEVAIGSSGGAVRTGIGFLIWCRRFDPLQVQSVGIGATSWQTEDRPNELIVIEADRKIKCGSLLPEERREWLQVILHELLTCKKPNRRREILSMCASNTPPF